MCAIAGIYCRDHRYQVDAEILTRMRDTMIHRGPDGCANWYPPMQKSD